MADYDFIVDNMRFSYSSLSTFETCPYSFKLSYIDYLERKGNFYAEYGTLVHSTMEKYFTKELDSYELSDYFLNNYDKVVVSPAPPPYGMYERYMEEGKIFFDNFSFDRELYDILATEEKIEFNLGEALFTARPDLILKNKESGIISLFDYKTSSTFKINKRTGVETADKKKLEGYYKQMYTYTYAISLVKGISIDEISLWFTRPDRIVTIPRNLEDEKKSINWVEGVIQKVKSEEVFKYDNSNPYFCNNLCNVRDFCEYRII